MLLARRPSLLGGAAVAGAALLLSGCGGAASAVPGASEQRPAATSPAGPAGPGAAPTRGAPRPTRMLVREPAVRAQSRASTAPAVRAPAVPARSGAGRRIVYAKAAQRVWLVDARGAVVRTYRVSGRPSQPDPGTYRVFSRSRHASSSLGNQRMQYMVRFTYGEATGAPVGFHDIPRSADGSYAQTLAQLGKPLSHGCVRQATPDARALWGFAPVGTRVVVVP